MSQTPRLNYDNIAPQYNQRYDSSALPERANALFELVQRVEAQRILEAGCGTGFWLDLLASKVKAAYGLDYSSGMLDQARGRPAPLRLSHGDAIYLPYQAGLEKIEAAIAREGQIPFRNELHIKMFTGFKPGADL